MSEPPNEGTRPLSNRALADAIRGNALSLVIGGGICLFFGFRWLVDAPGSASDEAAKGWYAVDQVFRWVLRVIGVIFLAAAAWSWTGQRASLLLAVAAEAGFALLMLAMAVDSTLEARADGSWDAFAILFAILVIIGISAAKRSWELYVSAGRTRPATTAHDG
jgi:hypothetical protein